MSETDSLSIGQMEKETALTF